MLNAVEQCGSHLSLGGHLPTLTVVEPQVSVVGTCCWEVETNEGAEKSNITKQFKDSQYIHVELPVLIGEDLIIKPGKLQ